MRVRGKIRIKFKSKSSITLTVVSTLVLLLVLANILPLAQKKSSAANSFQSNYDSGSLDASFSLGSGAASTDTSLPSLNAAGYGGTNSLQYSYDGTSTLKYPTASNLPADKGSIEMKFQKSVYGNSTDQDVGAMDYPKNSSYDPSTGFIYFADRMNNRIVKTKIDGTGWQTFGHYGSGVGQFSSPMATQYDSSTGFIYVLDSCNNRIVKTKIDGTGWTTLGGLGTLTPSDGCSNRNLYYFQSGLYYDSINDYLYVGVFRNSIVKVKMDGTNKTTITDNAFYDVRAVYYDSVNDWIYGATGGDTTRKLSRIHSDGTGLEQTATTNGCGSNQLSIYETSISYDSVNNLFYMADRNCNRIVRFNFNLTTWESLGGFTAPTSVHYDAASQYMFVTQLGGNIIKTQFDGSGWTTYGSYYKNLSKYNGPWGIYYDAPSGFMYVADTLNNRIIKTKQDGTGWQTYGTSGNGVGQFNQLQGLAYDPDTGFIYVSDYNNNRVVRTKIDGTGWATLSIPGPQGLYYDTLNDNIYVSTYNANVIRSKIDGTNQATLAGFSHAGGVYYDAASEVVYVADTSDYSRLVRSKMDSTEWDVLGKYTGKITLDLGSTQDINRAVLQANNTEHYRIRYSTDNLNWSTFFRVNKNASSGLRTRDSGALSAVSARYIQISALDRYTSPSVSEVSIYNTSGAIISNGITPTADYAPSFGSLGLITDGIFATEGTAYNNATYAVQHMYSTSNGSGVGEFNYYGGGHIWYDANTDFVYTSDLGNGRVVKTKMDGTGWTALGGFYNPRGVYYDSTTNYLYIGDYNNHRIVKTQIDGTGWWASSTSPYAKEKVLYSAQSTDDSRLVYDVASRKLRFYLAYSNKAQFVETPTLSLTDGSWYTVKASFNKAAHTLSIDLNGVNQVTQTYDTDWGSLSYGTSFYIGARNGSTTDRWDGMIDDININIESVDTTAPTNPTTLNTHFYYDNTKAVSFTSDSWGNSGTPYITWSGATDADSGLKGYYVYLGTDNTAEPNSTSGLLTPNLGARYFKTHVGADGAEQNVTVPANVLTTGVTYYLVLRTQDNDLNTTNKTTLFTYKYDGGAPAPPEFINASPAGCSTSSTFTFTWDAITDPVSGIAGYEYKNGSTGTIQQIADVSTLEKSPYQEGDNIIYIRTKDNAGNVSSWQTAVYCSTGIAYIIDGPTVVAGPSSIIVDWVSNKTTTSNVQVYEGNTYISEQGHTSYDITHNVKVVGLEPEKTYRYRLVWTDSSGNLGESEWYETATSKEPTVSNVKIDVVSPTRAIITWDTSEEAKAQLFYGAETAGTDTYAKSFIQNLDGLSGGTTYSVKIKSQNRDSYNFYSDAYSFSTPPIPIIGNLRFEPITDQSSAGVKVTWTTNVDTTSSVFVGPSSGALTEKSLSAPVKDHSISILDLQDNTNYSIYATGIDQYGNSAKSDTSTFKTSLDSRPPKIADLAIEATSTGTGTDAKAQIAVSFKTDESATAQVEYGEGSSSESYTSKTQEDTSYSTNHVVIIGNLDPSKIYHLRAVSRDRAGNTTNSEDNAVITKKPSESAFNLIMQSLTKAFSWLKIFN